MGHIAAKSGYWRNFHGPQRDAAWLFLTVFIALTGFPLGSFSSPTRCTGLANSPTVDYVLSMLSIIMVDCRHRLDFTSWLVCRDFPTVRGTNFDFVELCNIFVYCRASYFRIHSLTSFARYPLRFSSDSCLLARFTQGGISLNSAMKIFTDLTICHIRVPSLRRSFPPSLIARRSKLVIVNQRTRFRMERLITVVGSIPGQVPLQ